MKVWKSIALLLGFLVFGMLATVGLEQVVSAADAGAEAAGAGAACGIMCLCYGVPFLIGLAIMGGCGYIVYADANKNGVENGVLWAVIAAFTTWVGVLIYFLVIKKQHMEKKGM